MKRIAEVLSNKYYAVRQPGEFVYLHDRMTPSDVNFTYQGGDTTVINA